MSTDATIGYLRTGQGVPLQHGHQSEKSAVKADMDNFEAIIDIQQFSPDEITVKTVDSTLFVEGKHEEKADEHGYISRHFVRRYELPEDLKADYATSTLSSDGVLTVRVPKALQVEDDKSRYVAIKPTNSPAIPSSLEHYGPQYKKRPTDWKDAHHASRSQQYTHWHPRRHIIQPSQVHYLQPGCMIDHQGAARNQKKHA